LSKDGATKAAITRFRLRFVALFCFKTLSFERIYAGEPVNILFSSSFLFFFPEK
jgi:hypothetical protein